MFNVKVITKDNSCLFYEDIKIVEDDIETINIVDEYLKLVASISQYQVKEIIMVLCP